MKDIQNNEASMAEQKDNFQSQFDQLKNHFAALQDDFEIKDEELKVCDWIWTRAVRSKF